MSNEQYAGGLALDFFESPEFEEEIAGDDAANLAIQTRNRLRVLMSGWNDKWQNLLSWRAIKAILFERDHQMTKAFRLAFQQGFDHLFKQLQGQTHTTQAGSTDMCFSGMLVIQPPSDIGMTSTIEFFPGCFKRLQVGINCCSETLSSRVCSPHE